MGGGIIQLRTSGKQTKHIVGNPQTTHFKAVYFRHTNFAIESIPCIFNNSISNTSETDVSVIIHRTGDLVSNAHVEFTLKLTTNSLAGGTYVNFTNSTGYAAIKEVSIEINSQVIDRHYSEWFDIWNELTDSNYNEHQLVNKHNAKYTYLKSNNGTTRVKCYVPLKFWFCRNPGLALPLIALQNAQVIMKFKFRNPYTLINTDHTSGGIIPSYEKIPELYVDYIFLDTKEKRDFASKKHQYLIEQLQFNGKQTFSTSHDLNFDNPVKELIWVCQNKNVNTEYSIRDGVNGNADAYLNVTSSITKNNDYFNYQTESGSSQNEYLNASLTNEPFNEAELIFEGNSRFNKRKATYFRTIQPLNHHSKVPGKYIYCYSFSLKPEEHQPSGVCNFSKLKSAKITFSSPATNTDILIFAHSYNLLRIMEGKAGIAYAI